MHYYVFYRLEFSNSLLYSLISFSFIISNLLIWEYYGILTRVLYTLASVWMGFIFILFSLLLVYEFIRPFFILPVLYIGVIVSIYSIINSFFVAVKKIKIKSDKQLRAVLLTDIHVGTIKNQEFLKKIVDKTNALNPDVVFITGDIVAGSAPLRPHMFISLKDIKAKTYFVTGNHEIYEGADEVIKILDETNVDVLRNKIVDFKGYQIIGLDFGTDLTAIKNIKKNSIVLNHQPTQFEYAASKGAKLMLSGHTHNGQIFPFNLLVRLQYKYVTGLHKIKDSFLYVSPGTGTWGPPMRLGSRNEITLIEMG